ncbi:UPF0481 protein At3g47200-like [Typha latifolia]|uniref:UPF0481 protein At3g47200-like n=1 Tax=Typha latifolia TaxID=4733 RepID=UPI003C2CCD7A
MTKRKDITEDVRSWSRVVGAEAKGEGIMEDVRSWSTVVGTEEKGKGIMEDVHGSSTVVGTEVKGKGIMEDVPGSSTVVGTEVKGEGIMEDVPGSNTVVGPEKEEWVSRIETGIFEMPEKDDEFCVPPWELARLLEPGRMEEGPNIFKIEQKGHGKELHRVRVVAIGPYLQAQVFNLIISDSIKRRCVKFLIHWGGLNLSEYLVEMKQDEQRARQCYSKDFFLGTEKFLDRLLLDSCFILLVMTGFFRSDYKKEIMEFVKMGDTSNCEKNENNRVCQEITGEIFYLFTLVHPNTKSIKLDLLMLENQIPFFAIERLLQKCQVLLRHLSNCTVEELALSYFADLYPLQCRKSMHGPLASCRHLLDLFHWSRIPMERDQRATSSMISISNKPRISIPSAVELQESATMIRKKTSNHFFSEKSSIFDITFERNIIEWELKIPTLHVYDYTSSIFHNLIAFEKAYQMRGFYVTAYSACMARIVQTEKDAKLLRKVGILANTPKTDADVVAFFEDLWSEVEDAPMTDKLYDLFSKVTDNHGDVLSNCYGGMKQRYCANPVITFAACVAVPSQVMYRCTGE